MSGELGDAATLARIAEARSSAATRPCLDALEHKTFAALLRARGSRGARPYLVYHGDGGARIELDYTTTLDRCARRIGVLRSLGIERGDRIATLFHNDPEVPITCFAAWAIGAAVVPVNLGEDDERIAFVLGNSNVRALLALPEYKARAEHLTAKAAGGVQRHIINAESEAPLTLEDALAGPAPEPDDEALVVFTSGTTGAPKGVLLEQRNLLVDADALRRWNRIDEATRMMCVLPTHHVNGLVVTLVTPLLAGGSTVLCRRFQTADFWRAVAAERVQVVSVVPTLLAFLLEDARGAEGHDISAFRHLICGAGPLTVELAQRFERRFERRVLHGYGLSETTCYSCMLPVDLDHMEHQSWIGAHGFPSIGAPLPPNEMAIHDASGRALLEGERGEIVIRGVNVMRGYAGRPDANAESFAHGWFRSGDEGFSLRDKNGLPFFFITGRIKELIIRGGVNISPLEIDEVLNGIPGVARGLAVGFENDWYGEEIGAVVLPDTGAALDEQAVLEACALKLPFAKRPKVVLFGDEIPVTTTGKYQRGKLRPLFEAWRKTQFRAPAKR